MSNPEATTSATQGSNSGGADFKVYELPQDLYEAGFAGVLRDPSSDEHMEGWSSQKVWDSPAGRTFLIGDNAHGVSCVLEYDDDEGHGSWIECVTETRVWALRILMRDAVAKSAVRQCAPEEAIQAQEFGAGELPEDFTVYTSANLLGPSVVFNFATGKATVMDGNVPTAPQKAAQLAAEITGEAGSFEGWFAKGFELAEQDLDADPALAHQLHGALGG